MFFCVCLCLHWAFIHLDSSAIVIHSASQSPFIVVTISRIRNHSRGRMLISFPSGSSHPTAVVVRDRSRGRAGSRGRPQHLWPHGTIDTIVVDASRNEVKIHTVRPPSVAVSEEAERTSSENSIGPGTQLGLGIVMDSTGKTITVNVLESDKIDEVKAKVHTQTGISLCQKTLIFAGEVLEGGRKLRDYEIGHGNTLFLVDESSSNHEAREEGARRET